MPLVDLDDPAELRARWSALAAVAHATGYDRRWWADEIGWHHEDAAGNDLRMAVLDDDRAVLFGFHIEYSQTAVQASGTDLLGGAPEWIAQPEVRHRIATGELGFVYGQFSGTWARAGYPGDPWQPIDDGFLAVGRWLTSDEETAAELIEWAAEWADFLGSTNHLMPAALELVRAAGTTGISSDHLLDLFDMLGIGPGSPRHPDLAAALHAAADFGGPAPDFQPAAPAPQQADDWSGQDAFARLGLVDDPYYAEPAYDDPYQQPTYDDPYQQPTYDDPYQPAAYDDPYPEPYAGPRIEDYNDLFADNTPFTPKPPVGLPGDAPAAGSPFAPATPQPTARQSPADPTTHPDQWSPDAPPTHQHPTPGGSPFAPPAQQRPPAPQPQDHAANTSPFAPPTHQPVRSTDGAAEGSPFAPPGHQPSAGRSGERAAEDSPFAPSAQQPPAGRSGEEVADGRSSQARPSQQQPTIGQSGDRAADRSPFTPPGQQPLAARSGEGVTEAAPFTPPAQRQTPGDQAADGPSTADRTIRADQWSSQAPPPHQQPTDHPADGSPFALSGQQPIAERTDDRSGEASSGQQAPAGQTGGRVAEDSPFAHRAQQPNDRQPEDRAAGESPFAPSEGQRAAAGRSGDQAADGSPEAGRATRPDERSPQPRATQQAPAGRPGDEVADGSSGGDRVARPDEWSAQGQTTQGAAAGQSGGRVAEDSPFAHRAQQPTDGQPGERGVGEAPFAPSEGRQGAAGRSGEGVAGGSSVADRAAGSDEWSPPPQATEEAAAGQTGGRVDEGAPFAQSARQGTNGRPGDRADGESPFAASEGAAAVRAGEPVAGDQSSGGRPSRAVAESAQRDGEPPQTDDRSSDATSPLPPTTAPTGQPPSAAAGGLVGGTSLPGATVGKANGKAGKGRGSRRRDRGPDGVPEQAPEPAQASKLVFPSFIPPVTEEPPAAPVGSLEAAMRAETERKRPRQRRTEAEEALHEWCLARTRVVPSGFTIEVQALDPSALVFTFDLQPPPVPGFDRIKDLLNDLWQAEAHADRGGWLFARIDAAGRTLRIDRWYDQVPSWWEHDLDDAVDIPGLLRRLSDRGPQWRPSYLNRLPAAR